MISVIVPVHNSATFLRECLESIINSSYKELEIICVGNSFTVTDERIHYVMCQSDIYSSKVNLGINLAHGEYISIVDCDCLISAGMYSKLIEILKNTEADFVKCNCPESGYVTGRLINPLFDPSVLLNCVSEDCCGLYRKDFILNNNITFYSHAAFSILTTLLASKVYLISDTLFTCRADTNRSVKEEWNWIDYQVRKRCIANPEQLFYLHKCKMSDYEWAIKHLDALEAFAFSNYTKGEVLSSIVSSQPEHIFRKLCLNVDRIQIYGAGIWGKRVLDYLEAVGISNKVSDFIVSNPSGEDSIKGIHVSSISEGFVPSKDCLIIVAISGEPGKLVYSNLSCMCFRNTLLIDNNIKHYISSELKRFSSFRKCDSLKEIQKKSIVKIMDIICSKPCSKNLYIEMEKDLCQLPDSADNVFIYYVPKDKLAFKELIKKLVTITKSNGKICLLVDNKLGLDALCNISASRELRYSREELKTMLKSSGIEHFKFFSVFPGRILPQILISENIRPASDTVSKCNQMFYFPEDCIVSEQELFRTLDENTDIHVFAPSYFIECSLNEQFSDVEQITLTMQRRPENSTCTIIRSDVVEKIRACSDGDLLSIKYNLSDLKKRDIPVVKIFNADSECITMEKLQGCMGDEYLAGLLKKDVQLFKKELDSFIRIIFQSSEIKPDNQFEFVLKTGYVDLLPLNTIYKDYQFVVFDQEYTVPDFPVKAQIYRVISSLYSRYPECEKKYPISILYEKYGLTARLELWKKCSDFFNNNLCENNISQFIPSKYHISRNQLMLNEISSNNTFNSSSNILLKKPYRVGYCIGVFDLFHIGHVNLLKAAKEMCDYLIVAVASDADCEKSKHKTPVIPFIQRVNIVKSCRYVDEVVDLIPNAFEKYHFDVQFSGSDHETDSKWIKIKEELRLKGSDIIFLPYTNETNSSKIREEIQL